MKTTNDTFIILTFIFVGLLCFSCTNDSVSPEPFNNLETRFVSGFISADLMPVIPPDPIICKLTLLVKNKSSSVSLAGLSILIAEVFLYSTNARLGTIHFSTTWDGQLGPNEEDTVHLSKVISPTSLFTPPCEQYVYLNLAIRHQSTASKTLKIDSLLFRCTH